MLVVVIVLTVITDPQVQCGDEIVERITMFRQIFHAIYGNG